jgi:hypothetical protein
LKKWIYIIKRQFIPDGFNDCSFAQSFFFISEVSGSLKDRSKFYDKITSKCLREKQYFMLSHPSVSTDSRKPSCWLRQCLVITFLSLWYYLECSSFETRNVSGISYSLLQLPGTILSIFSLHAIFENPTFQLSRLRHTLFSKCPMNFTYGLGKKMCAVLSTLFCPNI